MIEKGIEKLRSVWLRRAAGSLSLALGAIFVSMAIAGAHVARAGTLSMRIIGAGVIIGAAAAWLVVVWREHRIWRDPARTLRRVLIPADERLGGRALRALRMATRSETDPSVGEPELARLHFERLLSRASVDAVEGVASQHASLWRGIAVALLFGAAIVVFFSPLRIVEGFDVLAAMNGKAPLPLSYLRYHRITAYPPSYTRHAERSLVLGSRVALPQGTVITVRGTPRSGAPALIVTDGIVDVPFVSDGAGGLVARYTVTGSATVRVAARFGDVRIEEEEALSVEAIEDMPPAVRLAEAPRSVELSDVDRIDLRWAARDDYGLRQVDLVLRSGAQEERRVLARFDGATTVERGGHTLRTRDAFLRRAFLPVEIRIEARDNDPVTGSNWGRSSAVTVLPPSGGEPEAKRYLALVGIRDALADYVGWLRADGDPKARSQADIEVRVDELMAKATAALEKSYAGLAVPEGVRSFALGQLRRIRAAKSRADVAVDVMLAIDAALRALAVRDAQVVAKRLGDVAEEIATAARLGRETEQRKDGVRRTDVAIDALSRGVGWLKELGSLGHDVGGVAAGDLGRIRRSRERDDLTHTELAALHLAARLRRPNPSFGAAGGRGGVEAGAGRGQPQPGEGAPASGADSAFDRLVQELSELAREHGDAVGGVERVLDEARSSEDLQELKQEAAERARALRAAVEDLPPPGEEPGSRRAAEALGKEHANAMAHSLEQLEIEGAVENGESAVSSLEQALKRDGFGTVSEERMSAITKEVREQVAWAKSMSERLRKNAEARARDRLSQAGDKEKNFAKRAEQLAGHGEAGEASLPDEMLDRLERARSAMQQAARALAEGRGRDGLEHQRDAQRLLEQSETRKTSDGEDEAEEQQRNRDSSRAGDGQDVATGGDVPPADEKMRAEEFRERVLKGLGQEKSDRLAPAVKRYAEGLLR